MPKKTERGDPLGFFNIHSVAKQQKKLKGGPFEEKNFRKKVSQCRKKLKGEKVVENFEKFQFFNNVHQSRD